VNPEYPNHYEMKQKRLIKFNQTNFICEKCRKERAKYIHHKDKTKSNHSMDNLMPVCPKCHADLHKGERGRPRKTPLEWGYSGSNEYSKQRYRQYKNKILGDSKKYYSINREERLEYSKKYHQEHLEKIKSYQKEYRNRQRAKKKKF